MENGTDSDKESAKKMFAQLKAEVSDIKIELVCQNEYIAKDGVFNQDIDINEENIEYQIKLTYKDEIRVIDCSSRIER